MWYVVSATCTITKVVCAVYNMLCSALSPSGPLPSLPCLQDGRSLLHAATHSGNCALVQWLVTKYGLEATVTKVSVTTNQLEMSCGTVLVSLVLTSTGWRNSAGPGS